MKLLLDGIRALIRESGGEVAEATAMRAVAGLSQMMVGMRGEMGTQGDDIYGVGAGFTTDVVIDAFMRLSEAARGDGGHDDEDGDDEGVAEDGEGEGEEEKSGNHDIVSFKSYSEGSQRL